MNKDKVIKFDCKNSFFREYRFNGKLGEIVCPFYWEHVIVTLGTSPKFSNGKAIINELINIEFKDSIYPLCAADWDVEDEKIFYKIQKIFDDIIEQGDPSSKDGRDKCLSQSVIIKLKKLGFDLTTDIYLIDKKFKNLYTKKIISEVLKIQ
jgi:hypothetical protein